MNLDSKTGSGYTVSLNPYPPPVRVCNTYRSVQFSDITKKHEMAENVERKKQGLKRQSNRMIPTFKNVENRHERHVTETE
jgi:hypothetical protein